MPTTMSGVTASPAAAGGYAGAVVEIGEWILFKAGIADIPSEVTIALMVVLAPILHVAAKWLCKKLDCSDLNEPAVPAPAITSGVAQ